MESWVSDIVNNLHDIFSEMIICPGNQYTFPDVLLDVFQALDILCSILQTNSLQTVQAWIEQATDEGEKLYFTNNVPLRWFK